MGHNVDNGVIWEVVLFASYSCSFSTDIFEVVPFEKLKEKLLIKSQILALNGKAMSHLNV
jgi:hypothetical protein